MILCQYSRACQSGSIFLVSDGHMQNLVERVIFFFLDRRLSLFLCGRTYSGRRGHVLFFLYQWVRLYFLDLLLNHLDSVTGSTPVWEISVTFLVVRYGSMADCAYACVFLGLQMHF